MTPLEARRLKKFKKRLDEMEGAVGLLAQRLHNAETMLCKATAMAISLAPPSDRIAMQAELTAYFQCSDSLGAFEIQAYYTADDEGEDEPTGLRLADCEPTEDNDNGQT